MKTGIFSYFPWLFCISIHAAPLPQQLASALERVKGGLAGAAEERELRRYANEAEAGPRVTARVGLARVQRKRGQTRAALPWVEEYAAPTPENLAWPRIQGLVEVSRLRAELGQTFDALQRLNRARETAPEGLARTAVLRALSELLECQPDLDKALEYESLALEQGITWFRRRRVEETDSREWQPPKPGHETWEIWKPEIEARVALLRRRIRVDRYGLDFVLYEEAQSLRRADHPLAMEFLRVEQLFGERGGPTRLPEADFTKARERYLELVRGFPDGIYAEAATLHAAVCLAHLGDTRGAIQELNAFFRRNPTGLYRGEALKIIGDLALFAQGDPRNALEAYGRAAAWLHAVSEQTRVLETYAVPEKSRDISRPPESVRSLDGDGILRTEPVPIHTLVNRSTAPWYVDFLRAEVEWKRMFLAYLRKDAEAARRHLDLALAHDPALRRQAEAGFFNAFQRIRDSLDSGRPFVGEPEEMGGLREREALLIQWADMRFMLEDFDTARELYRRIRAVADRNGRGAAVTRALAAESLLLRAKDDPNRGKTVPELLAAAEKYPDTPSAPHLLHRAGLLWEGPPQATREIFDRVNTLYPRSSYAVQARHAAILRTLSWKDHDTRRHQINQFKRDFPKHTQYHEALERFDRILLERDK